jgi:hypothetical protein
LGAKHKIAVKTAAGSLLTKQRFNVPRAVIDVIHLNTIGYATVNLAIRAGFCYPFAKSAKHFLTINAFATVKAVEALQQLRFQFFKRFRRLWQMHGLVFLETAESGADDFTGGLIKTALNFFFHKLCQFWRQRYIHDGISIKFTSLGIIP